MTVLHIVPDDRLGGGAVIVAHLARGLARRPGAPAQRVILPQNAEPDLRALFAELPHVFAAYPGRGPAPVMARAIAPLCARGDLLHAHGARAAAACAALRAFRRGLGLVYTVHGFHGLARDGRLGLRAWPERALGLAVDATAFVSRADRDLARARGIRHRGPARVIENGVAAPRAARRAHRDIDLLFVGRLAPQKHPLAFVETAALLPRGLRIVMVGAGELAPEVDAAISARGLDNLRRLDGLDHAATLARMARARLLVMTSRWEGLPTVAIEALISRCAVAGYAIPPLAEILGPDADDFLTDPDPKALAARIAALRRGAALDPARIERLGARAQAAYGIDRMVDDYLDLYRQIAPQIAP